jgi:hypothetical protein
MEIERPQNIKLNKKKFIPASVGDVVQIAASIMKQFRIGGFFCSLLIAYSRQTIP